LPSSQIYDVPDSLTVEQAILTEPLANIVHMFRIVAPSPFFRFAIVGAGTMGALALQAAVRIGARERLAVDVNEQRLAIMQQLGATSVVNVTSPDGSSEAQRIAGRGFDVVLDASGSAPARQMAFDLCRPGGLVVLLGMAAQRSEVNFVASIRKEHRVVMSFAYTPVDFRRALDLLIQNEISLTPWTVSLPLDRGQEAMERMSHNPGVALKMIMEVARS